MNQALDCPNENIGSASAGDSSSARPTLLVIDDEPNIVFSIKATLASPQLDVISATTAREGIELVRLRRPDAVVLDVRLPDQSGLDAFDAIRQIDPRLPVIIMTAFAKTETAIDAMRRGAYEYLTKPVELRQLKDVIAKALHLSRLNRIPAVIATEQADDQAADRIVGQSQAMQEVYKKIGRIAPLESTVLIIGESGTGKELVARAIYHHSNRKDKPFLAINCAALPDTILESELFGHERGAFTGADQRRIGKFEQVSGGTIFLDEIGDMSPATQAKALRLLEEQQFERVGGNITVKTDVRIIAATNRDLIQDVAGGRFRQDLLYRLNGFTIQLPPLRDRTEDIPALAEHFVALFNHKLGRTAQSISPQVIELLQRHRWPGNVREIESAIRYALVHATGDVLIPEDLPDSCNPKTAATANAPQPDRNAAAGSLVIPAISQRDFPFVKITQYVIDQLKVGQPGIYRSIIHEVDRHILSVVLDFFHGNQSQAAERLGVSRMTLRAKLRAFGMLENAGANASHPDDEAPDGADAPFDVVQEAGEESFPASDSPAF